MKKYELLDHTADIGIITSGRELPEVFGNAAFAMFDILTDTSKISKKMKFHIQVSASNIEELLVRWLDELLFRYETERIICNQFVIDEISNESLSATVYGEKINLSRHEIKTEIKNITYHQLKVEKADDGWRVQVIFDV